LEKEFPSSAEPIIIRPRANESGKSRRSYLRGKTAKELIKDPKAWKTNHGYGQRWQIGKHNINIEEKIW
jgi:hypothetical protein